MRNKLIWQLLTCLVNADWNCPATYANLEKAIVMLGAKYDEKGRCLNIENPTVITRDYEFGGKETRIGNRRDLAPKWNFADQQYSLTSEIEYAGIEAIITDNKTNMCITTKGD